MENNNVYNLMTQMTQESKSLWRIKNDYLPEADTDELKAFWNTLLADKEKHIIDLKILIKNAL